MPNTSAIIPWLLLNNSENFQIQAAASWARLVFEHPIFQSQSYDAINFYIVKDTFYEFSRYLFGRLCILAILMEKFYIQNSTYVPSKIHIFWEGHKMLRIFTLLLSYVVPVSKIRRRFRKILWPSQLCIWALPATILIPKS